MTKEEFDSLFGQKVEIDAQELHRLKARLYTHEQYGHNLKYMCPNCYEVYIADCYICPCCGYDDSHTVEEWNKMHKEN